jgi:hypothetical protein
MIMVEAPFMTHFGRLDFGEGLTESETPDLSHLWGRAESGALRLISLFQGESYGVLEFQCVQIS